MRPDARAGPGRSAEAHALAAGGVETQMLGMLRFLRVLRVGRLVNRLTERWTTDATYVEAAKFLVYVLLTAHLLACLFFLWPVIWIEPVCEAGCGCPPGGAAAADYAAWLERAMERVDGCEAEGPACACNSTAVYPKSWRQDYGLDGGDEPLAHGEQVRPLSYQSLNMAMVCCVVC